MVITISKDDETDVAHQSHYSSQKIQPIVYMMDTMTPEQFKGYLKGNVIKYISRYQRKNGIEDLEKAKVYLSWLIEFEKEGEITL